MTYSKMAQEENWQKMLLHHQPQVKSMIQRELDLLSLELSADNNSYLVNNLFQRGNIFKQQDIELILPGCRLT